MFNYTTTTILNSNLDSSGLTKVTGSATGLNVLRVNNFKKDGIVSIYKNPYTAGVKEVAKVTIPTVTAGKVIRLTVDIRLSQQTESEYANTYLYFKKPVVVEVIASGTAATDALALVNALKGLKTEFGFNYLTPTLVNTADIQVTAINNNQRFFSMVVESDKSSPNSLIQPEYDNITGTTFSVTTAGKIGFGDDEYMVRSIMLPTYENTRYFGINKEERPVLGGNYTQYTLRYSIAKDVDYNLGIVGMGDRSITNHVFYVKSDVVAAFEAAIANVGLTIPALLTYTVADNSLANAATTTSVVLGAVGPVVFSITSGTSATVNATTGVITADATTDGATVVRATDAVGNYAEVTITVA